MYNFNNRLIKEKAMEYLIIFMMCLLATSKMTFQSAFSKHSVKNSTDAVVFNIFVFITSALLFLPNVFDCPPPIWIYAVVEAAFTLLYQFFYTTALSVGNVSITVLIVNFSMVLNVLISYIFYNEPISLLRFCGIILTIISFVISNKNYNTKGIQKKWLLFTLLSLLTSSAATMVQKVFGESMYKNENQAFISCFYIIAALFAVVLYNVLKKNTVKTLKIGFGVIKYAIATGICLALFQFFNTYALSRIDGTVLFPAYTGGTIILSTLSGVLIFKDNLSKKQVFAIFIGIAALVLMNF